MSLETFANLMGVKWLLILLICISLISSKVSFYVYCGQCVYMVVHLVNLTLGKYSSHLYLGLFVDS